VKDFSINLSNATFDLDCERSRNFKCSDRGDHEELIIGVQSQDSAKKKG